jgi:hypothetical protein
MNIDQYPHIYPYTQIEQRKHVSERARSRSRSRSIATNRFNWKSNTKSTFNAHSNPSSRYGNPSQYENNPFNKSVSQFRSRSRCRSRSRSRSYSTSDIESDEEYEHEYESEHQNHEVNNLKPTHVPKSSYYFRSKRPTQFKDASASELSDEQSEAETEPEQQQQTIQKTNSVLHSPERQRHRQHKHDHEQDQNEPNEENEENEQSDEVECTPQFDGDDDEHIIGRVDVDPSLTQLSTTIEATENEYNEKIKSMLERIYKDSNWGGNSEPMDKLTKTEQKNIEQLQSNYNAMFGEILVSNFQHI